MEKRLIYLLGGLGVAVALWLYSRTKDGGDAVDSVVGDALDFIDVSATRIKNAVTSRGYRNNNPGNLRFVTKNPWSGQVANDGGYGVYDTPANGTRALGHQLRAYAARGLVTVRDIISTWAPTTENETYAYIADVAGELEVAADAPLDVEDSLADLACAIAKHENGYVADDYDWNWVYLP